MDDYASLDGYRDEVGRFTQLPGKRQKNKQAQMLAALASHFQPGRTYTEREINEILNQHHTFNDPATLRRMTTAPPDCSDGAVVYLSIG
jgi:hypothetical protein